MPQLPLGDWQFYVVTGAALGAVWLIVRPFLPRKGQSTRCPNCADAAASKRRPPRTGLTVEGKRV